MNNPSDDALSNDSADGEGRDGWTTLGGELREQNPQVFEELTGIARDIVRSLRARPARERIPRTEIFGIRKVKPRA